jgi:hypothetical protein
MARWSDWRESDVREGAAMKNFCCVIVLVLCMLAFPAVAQFPDCEDFVYALVVDGQVQVFHEGAVYNCCPERFDYAVDVVGSTILVTETEIEGEPCDCDCCFDLKVTILDLAPGTYDLNFSWYDYYVWEWAVWLLEVTVPDLGQPGDPVVGDVLKSDCYWNTTGVGEPGYRVETWGLIKALYR